MIGGTAKRDGKKVAQSVYREIDGYRDDYLATRRVATKKTALPSWWPNAGVDLS
jgi:hypothetical protein